jgi:hypothetical protein
MSAIARLFQLHMTPPFDRLRREELAVIAGVSRETRWQPGEIIAGPDQPLRHLLIIRQGAVTLAERPLPPIIGASALLFEQPLPGPLVADPTQGAAGLTINRGHFFTIVNECPGLLMAFHECAGDLVSTWP